MKDKRRLARGIGLGGGDLAIFEHGVDHEIAALLRAIGMIDRRIDCGAFGKSREQSRFIERELLGRLAEVELGCRFKAVDAVSEKNLIGVEREDLRLGEATLDLDREHRFLDFALPASVGGEEEVACELHR